MSRLRDPPHRVTDPDRWRFLQSQEADLLQEAPRLEPLLERLLGLGGDFAVLPAHEPDLDRVLARGEAWTPSGERCGGRQSACHANVASLLEAGLLELAATGYALTWDEDGIGVWRQHSWGLLDEDTVLETTEPRNLYYGFVMSPAEAARFVRANL